MHFFIADSTGQSAVVEYKDNELVVTPSDDEPWQVVTNTMVYKQSTKKLRKSCSRYNWIDQYLEANHNALSTIGIRGLLSNVSVNKVYSPQFDISVTTQWSVIYNISERCIDIYSRRNYRNNYHYNFE
jgi:hypothetical protein